MEREEERSNRRTVQTCRRTQITHRAEHLFSLHANRVHPHVVRFLRHLRHGAAGTAEAQTAIADNRTGNALGLSHLLSHNGQDNPVNGRSQQDAAQEAALPHRFGRLTEGIAGEEVGQQADAAVIETSTKSMFPFHDMRRRRVLIGLVRDRDT